MRMRDLDEIVIAAESDFRAWTAARLYVTGGTGFVGAWLLRAFAHANRTLGTNVRLDVLTRDPQRFCEKNGDLAHIPNIRFLRGDVLRPVRDGTYDAVIHAAATSGTAVAPGETIRTIVDGTRAIIHDVIAPSGPISALFVSSGAIYGRAPATKTAMAENYRGLIDHLDFGFAYHESKRLAELSFAIAREEYAIVPKIARLFAFLGPGLPLDAHFAAGNFLQDALRGGPISVNSGGGAMRTYLYPTDMIAWCLAVLTRGIDGRAYNVGSDEAVTIRDLAERIAVAAGPEIGVRFAKGTNPAPQTYYVPDVALASKELGVRRIVDLDEAISRTLDYHRARKAADSSIRRAEISHPK